MDDSAFKEILAKLDDMLTRERLFREDFERRLSAELRAHVDEEFRRHRRRTALVYNDRAKVLIHTPEGQRLILDMQEPFMAYHLIENGEWETQIRDVMRSLLPDGGAFVDVGANIGVHTLFAASLVGSDGHVVALEPHPATASILRENLEINGLLQTVTLLEVAAASRASGKVSFQYFPKHPAMSGFKISDDRLDSFGSASETMEVESMTLDQVVAKLGRTPDLIKIDVEGFELHVLEGAANTVAAEPAPSFIVEYEHGLIASLLGEDAPSAFWRFIESAGYIAYPVTDRLAKTPMAFSDLTGFKGDLALVKLGSSAQRALLSCPDPTG